MTDVKFFAFDTETSDNDPRTAELLSFACILLRSDLSVVAQHQWFVHPSDPSVVKPEAAAVNGYSHQAWVEAGAMTPAEFRSKLRSTLLGYKVRRARPLGHFIKFDLDVLQACAAKDSLLDGAIREALHFVAADTAVVAATLDDIQGHEYAQYNLTALCDRYGIALSNAHDSLADIQATVALYTKLRDVMLNRAPLPAPKPSSVFQDGKIKIGKYSGTAISALPKDYLGWMLRKMTLCPEDTALIQANLSASRP